MRIRRTGTKVSPSFDANKVAAGLSRPGIDPRVWVAEGIIATIGDDGEVDDTDANAVISSPEGREADVVLLPELEHHITCRIPSGGPESTDDWPISPGDHVALVFPGGDPASGGIVVAVLNSASDRLPTEDGQPMFKHDRRLIWCGTGPIDLRAGSGTGRLVLGQDGTVRAGGPDAAQAAVKGTDFMQAFLDAMHELQLALASAAGAAAASPLTPLAGPLGDAAAALAKLTTDALPAGNWLSTVLKTK